MTVFLALAAYNEEQGLPALFEQFRDVMNTARLPFRVVVVDDGSRDRTADVVQHWASHITTDLTRHPVNCGLGETIRDALMRAAELAGDDDVIVTMDADNTHPPALIPAMLARLQEGHDLVIASRYRPGADVVGLSSLRRCMSLGARFLFQAAFPIPGVRDYTCGFRAYRARLLKQAFACFDGSLVTESSFACMAEILLKCNRMQARMCEVPLVLRYDQKKSTSKMSVGRTVWKTLQMMYRNRFLAHS
jgi:dolichol-phosphate mannosyltransferase